MKQFAILSVVGLMVLAPTAIHAEIPPTVITKPDAPVLRPNAVPNQLQLAPTVTGKIHLNGVPGICPELKIKLSDGASITQSATIKSLAVNQCEYRVVIPQSLQGKTGLISVDTPIGTYVQGGQSRKSLTLPATGGLEDINFTVVKM